MKLNTLTRETVNFPSSNICFLGLIGSDAFLSIYNGIQLESFVNINTFDHGILSNGFSEKGNSTKVRVLKRTITNLDVV